MSSHRKRVSAQPSRRPQVAGLRKPASKPSPQPRPRPTPYSAQHEDLVEDLHQEPNGAEPSPVAEPDEAAEVKPSPRPAPRPKAPDTGSAKPVAVEQADLRSDEPAEAAHSAAAPAAVGESKAKAIVSITAVLALIFAVAAGFFAYKLVNVNSVTDNRAISDAVGTEQVQQEVSAAVETLLSYDYTKIGEHEKNARSLLVTDQVREEFDALYGDVKKKAPEQKLVLVTKVSYSSVLELDDDTAKVLVFVEQSASRKGTDQKSSGGGQLTISAQQQDGKWRLAGIDTYGEIKQPAGDGKNAN